METKANHGKSGIISAGSNSTSVNNYSPLENNSGTTNSFINQWNYPTRVAVNENIDHIEMIYKQTSMITYTIYPQRPPEERVFKIIFSCQDGKWHKSEPIYGKIIPESLETYEFD